MEVILEQLLVTLITCLRLNPHVSLFLNPFGLPILEKMSLSDGGSRVGKFEFKVNSYKPRK